MTIHQNYSLKALNTFGIDVKARYFVAINSVEELREALNRQWEYPILVLGGGSNMLLTKDLERVVLQIGIKGIEEIQRSNNEVVLRIAAGENWHQLVLFCLQEDFGGLENLSLIPGNVGTAPIQNIGAYGVELKDVFVGCEVMDMDTGKISYMDLEACRFGYRDSVFKKDLKGRVIITSIDLKLSVKDHQIKTTYGDIGRELSNRGIVEATIKDVSDAVIAIRQSKLPDPAQLGNSGSFFKNPELEPSEFAEVQKKFPEIPNYPMNNGKTKVPAGWLIDQAGLKGYRVGDAGVHAKQALVLVNYGQAKGSEILAMAQHVQQVVAERFGISLQPEVNIL